MNGEDKVSVVLEAVSKKLNQLDQATQQIDDATKASQRNISAVRQATRANADSVRIIDATARATEKATRAIERQNAVLRQSGRPNASLASDPNAFFAKELAKQQADATKAAIQGQAKRAEAVKRTAAEEVKAANASQRRELQLQNLRLRNEAAQQLLRNREVAHHRLVENQQRRSNAQYGLGEKLINRIGLRLLTVGVILRALRFAVTQFAASLSRLELKDETAAQALHLTNNFREIRQTVQGAVDVMVKDFLPILTKITDVAVKNKEALTALFVPGGFGLVLGRRMRGKNVTEEPAFAPPPGTFEKARNLGEEMNVALLKATADRTKAEADIRTAAIAAEKADYEKRVQQIRTIEVENIEQRNALLTQAARVNDANLRKIDEESLARKDENLAKFSKLDTEMNLAILESRTKRLETEQAMRAFELEQERIQYKARLEAINEIGDQSLEADKIRNALREEAAREHQEALSLIEFESAERRKEAEKKRQEELARALTVQLQTFEGVFGNMAGAVETFAGEGSAAYKAFATAQAVMSTAIGAIGAFTQASAAFPPPFGQIIGAVAAAAVVAFGAAQIAKIHGAFAEGGVVPGAISHKDNRLAMVATGEVILSGRARQSLERSFGGSIIPSLLSGTLPGYGRGFGTGSYVRAGRMGYATGGIVGPLDAGSVRRATQLSVSLMDARNRQDERDALAKDAEVIIIDRMNRRGNRLKA